MKRIEGIQIISLIVLGPFLLYPLIYCPFGLPYLYCSICYLKCFWSKLRWLFLLGMLVLNLKQRFYCSSVCPCGTIQDLQAKVKIKKFTLPRWCGYIKYFTLSFVIIVILVNIRSPVFIIDEQLFLYLAGLVFGLCFFSYRFWCLTLCPFRALSDITLKIRGLFLKK